MADGEFSLIPDLSSIKKRLIHRAWKRFPAGITPSGSRRNLESCFHIRFGLEGFRDNELVFEFNDLYGGTHNETMPIIFKKINPQPWDLFTTEGDRIIPVIHKNPKSAVPEIAP